MDRIGPFVYERHPARLPALDGDRDPAPHRVAIVGGGPVGMALALALARWGVKSVVLEADDTVCQGSRACCISRRSLEILEQLGTLPRHLATGLPWTGGRTFYGTEEIFQFAMPHDALQKLPPMINLQQYYLEEFLYERIRERPDMIDFRWQTELTRFEQDADGVTLHARCDDRDYTLRAAWMIACDGGQSPVRKQLGLKLEGMAFEGKYVIVDIELRSPHPTERRAWFDPPGNPGYTTLMHRQADDICRIDYQIPDDADMDEALKEENVRVMVQRHLEMIGEDHLPWEIVWISAYRAGAMTLKSYRHDRVLFAGNAAHAMPIFGVRGLNSGYDDAWNLGWKLAFVERGWAGAPLLDTYTDERVHGFRVNAASAIKSTEFMAPPSRGFRLMREAALSLSPARRDTIGKLANPRQTSAITYDGSPLNADGDALPAGPVPGAVLPECPLAGPEGVRYLTDLVQARHTAIVFTADGRIDAALDAELRALEDGPVPFTTAIIAGAGAPMGEPAATGPDWLAPGGPAVGVPAGLRRIRAIDADGGAAALYGAQAGAVYLVRPDGHVAGRWLAPTAAQLRAAFDRTLGRP